MDENEENARGYFVILNLIGDKHGGEPNPSVSKRQRLQKKSCVLEKDVQMVSSLFKEINYKVKLIENKTHEEIVSQLKTAKHRIRPEDDSFVMFIIGEDEPIKFSKQCKEYWSIFDESFDMSLLKPKILVQHHVTKGARDAMVGVSKEGEINVYSKISGAREEILKSKSIFMNVLHDVFLSYAHCDDIIELFTKICSDVEIEEFNKTDDGTLRHSVIFKTKQIDNLFRFSKEELRASDQQSYHLKEIKRSKDIHEKLYFEYLRSSKNGESVYYMTSNPRGFCVIINMPNDRLGSRIDEAKMTNLFKDLYFVTKVIRNKTHTEIREQLKHIRSQIQEDHNSFVLFLMSHGSRGGPDGKTHVFKDVLGEVETSSYIFEMFDGNQCSALRGKPKLFIVQTCFGDNFMGGVNDSAEADGVLGFPPDTIVKGNYMGGVDGSTEADALRFLPDTIVKDTTIRMESTSTVQRDAHPHSHFLIYHATLVGYYSFRFPRTGTSLVSAIDEVFRQSCADKPIQELLTMVTQRVSEAPTPIQSIAKWQQPQIFSNTWTKKVLLNPGFYTDKCLECYNTESKELQVAGTTAWFMVDMKAVMVADMNSTEIRQVNLNTTQTTPPYKSAAPSNIDVILQGVSLRNNRHVILVRNQEQQKESIQCIVIQTSPKLWEKLPIEIEIDNPIRVCDVLHDGYGILSELPKSKGGMLTVYRRDGNPTRSERITELDLPYGRNNENDIINVVEESIFILRFRTGVVIEYNFDGKRKRNIDGDMMCEPQPDFPGEFYKPSGVFKNDSGDVFVSCFNVLHKYHNDEWSIEKKLQMVLHMCCSFSHTVQVHEIHIDTSTAPCFPEMPHGVKPSDENVKLQNRYDCLWKSYANDVLWFGGKRSIATTPLPTDGESFVTEQSYEKGTITSGIGIGVKSFAIIVKPSSSEQQLVYVDVQNEMPDPIIFSEKSSLLKEPISLLRVNTVTHGILCAPLEDPQACIKIVDNETCNVLKTVNLGILDIGLLDKACVDHQGNLYVTNHRDNSVIQYHHSGARLAEISVQVPVSLYGSTSWFRVRQIMVDTDRGILVQCLDGRIHKYKKNKWITLPQFLGYTNDFLFHENKVFSVFGNLLNIHRIMDTGPILQAVTSDEYHSIQECSPIAMSGNPKEQNTSQALLPIDAVWACEEFIFLAVRRGCKIEAVNRVDQMRYLFNSIEPPIDFRIRSAADIPPTKSIHGAIYIGDRVHVIIITWTKDSCSIFKLIFMDIEPYKKELRELSRNPDMTGLPLHIFNVDKARYGILTSVQEENESQFRINTYLKKEDRLTSFVNIAYTGGSCFDSVNLAPSGIFYVACYRMSCVHRFSSEGVHIDTISLTEPSIGPPKDVHSDHRGDIIITTRDGSIFRKGDDEALEKISNIGPITHICYTGKYVYAGNVKKYRTYEIPDCDY